MKQNLSVTSTKNTANGPIKYIKNKDLLIEIHNSKNTFCSYIDKCYSRYDIIVNNVSLIDKDAIENAKIKRAASLSTKENKILPEEISVDDLVFRVMTTEHIPDDPLRKRRGKNINDMQAKINFPAFKHYILKDGVPFEVGRSHWKGGLQNGEFCTEHGKINNRLAMMFLLLVERYSNRVNWRGYCVDEQTEALTQRGWVNGDELSTDDTILSYQNGNLKWSSIKSIYRNNYYGNMFRLTVSGLDALVTPGHKFVTDSGLREVEMLKEKDQVILTGNPEEGSIDKKYEDDFVSLVGWVVTEGNFYSSKDRTYPRVSLYQNLGEKAQIIRNTISKLNINHSEHIREKSIRFLLTKDICNKLASVIDNKIGNKVLTNDFILSLTKEQRLLLIETMVSGDGHRTEKNLKRYTQKCKAHTDAFVMLCTLSGLRTSTKLRHMISYGKPTTVYSVTVFSERNNHSNVENINFHGGKNSGTRKGIGKHNHLNIPTVPYNGKVWCPETEFGSFMARRNGYVYLTGNSYVDEMRNHALLQLSQIGLQFDESKSDNPFAFFTTVITNCFTRVLNLEKRNHSIRDDLLIMSGAMPSFNRQIDDEIQQKSTPAKNEDGDVIEPVEIKYLPKRGRRPSVAKV